MKILIVGPEAAPFCRTGGLGDVLSVLPQALQKEGHDVRMVLPGYREVDFASFKQKRLDYNVSLEIDGRRYDGWYDSVHTRRERMPILFVRQNKLFDRDGMYVDPANGLDFDDNLDRYLFFCRASLAYCKAADFKPDVVHIHDWQAALLASILKTELAGDPFWTDTKVVLTIHNLAYQGTFSADQFHKTKLPERLMEATGPFEFYEKMNLLKSAIWFADKITTVSPRYAREIQTTSELGCGLEGVLRERSADLVGILNGVDYKVWSPSRDHKIPFRYHAANLSGKRMNKIELLSEAGLPQRDGTPLIGVVSRLVDQKGFDLIEQASEKLFGMNIQMVLLGTGDAKYHKLFAKLETQYPDKLKCYLGFDDRMAHLSEAASDIFLMPSRFEPCGLNQMYSLKYGTVPIVRSVGGLADSVIDYDPETTDGTGFVFEDYTSDAMMDAIGRAVALFAHKRPWMKLMKNGMSQDFSWKASAELYLELFDSILGSRSAH
jgi:starch synthase